ncbi:putative T7SS-secreted protein [Streptomyces sp. NPDC058807]|uniref:putative T7SS-secreted protein n=1 Tax=unclassified Streptomyces TaxID=2593676 RepID=UPI00369E6776
MKDRFPALEFVPCPGDPQTSKHVANIVQRTAKALDEISDALHGTDEADWKGRHANAFREQFDDTSPRTSPACWTRSVTLF